MNRLAISMRALMIGLTALTGLIGFARAGSLIAISGDRDGQAMTNVVIALKPIGVAAAVTAPAIITLIQESLQFKPYISVIRKGSSVVFANRDTVEHHIKSFSSSRPFEIAVHKPGDTPPPILFDSEGAIIAYCILHDWMRAYVYVADTPWFGLSDTTGLTRVDNVPAGDYEVSAWHPDQGQFKPHTVPQAPKSSGVKTTDVHQYH